MILTPEQQEEFRLICNPLLFWLNENCHPHVSVIIDGTSAELVEGICTSRTDQFVKD